MNEFKIETEGSYDFPHFVWGLQNLVNQEIKKDEARITPGIIAAVLNKDGTYYYSSATAVNSTDEPDIWRCDGLRNGLKCHVKENAGEDCPISIQPHISIAERGAIFGPHHNYIDSARSKKLIPQEDIAKYLENPELLFVEYGRTMLVNFDSKKIPIGFTPEFRGKLQKLHEQELKSYASCSTPIVFDVKGIKDIFAEIGER